MKVIVHHEGKKGTVEEDLQKELALDSSAFDVPGWVSVESAGVSFDEVHINDLYAAVVGLKAEYDEFLKKDALL